MKEQQAIIAAAIAFILLFLAALGIRLWAEMVT